MQNGFTGRTKVVSGVAVGRASHICLCKNLRIFRVLPRWRVASPGDWACQDHYEASASPMSMTMTMCMTIHITANSVNVSSRVPTPYLAAARARQTRHFSILKIQKPEANLQHFSFGRSYLNGNVGRRDEGSSSISFQVEQGGQQLRLFQAYTYAPGKHSRNVELQGFALHTLCILIDIEA
eukprot:1626289-Pleurochrysis_carterae.AAC.7